MKPRPLQEVRARGLALILLDGRRPPCPRSRKCGNWTTLPILLILEPDRLAVVRAPTEADDILVKPVREEELLYRVRNLCHGSAQDAEVGRTLKSKGLTLDESRYEIRLDGELIDLTYREFELLKHLINNPERVFDREQLLNLVWGIRLSRRTADGRRSRTPYPRENRGQGDIRLYPRCGGSGTSSLENRREVGDPSSFFRDNEKTPIRNRRETITI